MRCKTNWSPSRSSRIRNSPSVNAVRKAVSIRGSTSHRGLVLGAAPWNSRHESGMGCSTPKSYIRIGSESNLADGAESQSQTRLLSGSASS